MSEQESNNHNLINFIAATVETMRDQMATKSDLSSLREQMATKSDLSALRDQMATKSDIAAVRGDIEQIQLRLDSIERALRARLDQIEVEVSRLRSVVYLLVKDRPDMLRLLGQTPPPGEESRP
ncbi:MAG TPA: hypothetical protein VF791_14065 [Pyrinomonadaceae bacterium]